MLSGNVTPRLASPSCARIEIAEKTAERAKNGESTASERSAGLERARSMKRRTRGSPTSWLFERRARRKRSQADAPRSAGFPRVRGSSRRAHARTAAAPKAPDRTAFLSESQATDSIRVGWRRKRAATSHPAAGERSHRAAKK